MFRLCCRIEEIGIEFVIAYLRNHGNRKGLPKEIAEVIILPFLRKENAGDADRKNTEPGPNHLYLPFQLFAGRWLTRQ
jgi:hypothetical protein